MPDPGVAGNCSSGPTLPAQDKIPAVRLVERCLAGIYPEENLVGPAKMDKQCFQQFSLGNIHNPGAGFLEFHAIDGIGQAQDGIFHRLQNQALVEPVLDLYTDQVVVSHRKTYWCRMENKKGVIRPLL